MPGAPVERGDDVGSSAVSAAVEDPGGVDPDVWGDADGVTREGRGDVRAVAVAVARGEVLRWLTLSAVC